jgi:hypothetical protein
VVTDRDRSVVQWVAVIGAVSAQDVMARFGVGRTVGYRRLRALVDHGLLSRARLVYGQPALYVATREGLTWAAMPQVDPLGVGFATTRDWATCARLAVVLERGNAWMCGASRGYAPPSSRRTGRSPAHRWAAWPTAGRGWGARTWCSRPDTAPVAVDVELSVEGARRLEVICRSWARGRIVSEIRYYPPPHAARAVSRAVSASTATTPSGSCPWKKVPSGPRGSVSSTEDRRVSLPGMDRLRRSGAHQ